LEPWNFMTLHPVGNNHPNSLGSYTTNQMIIWIHLIQCPTTKWLAFESKLCRHTELWWIITNMVVSNLVGESYGIIPKWPNSSGQWITLPVPTHHSNMPKGCFPILALRVGLVALELIPLLYTTKSTRNSSEAYRRLVVSDAWKEIAVGQSLDLNQSRMRNRWTETWSI
jgi:hypothetical protein